LGFCLVRALGHSAGNGGRTQWQRNGRESVINCRCCSSVRMGRLELPRPCERWQLNLTVARSQFPSLRTGRKKSFPIAFVRQKLHRRFLLRPQKSARKSYRGKKLFLASQPQPSRAWHFATCSQLHILTTRKSCRRRPQPPNSAHQRRAKILYMPKRSCDDSL
jgi:hypothetical protein